MQRSLVVAALLSALACSEDDAKLAPNAMLVDGATHALLSEVTDAGDLVFSGMTAQLESVDAQSVLVFTVGPQTPLGAMRYVLSVAAENAGVRVATRAATINEAFQELHFEVRRDLVMPQNPGALLSAQPQVTSGVSFPFDFELSGDAGRINISGEVAVAPELDFNLDFDLASFTLEELSLEVGASESFRAEIVGEGSVSEREDFTVATIPFTPIIITVGSVPVVLTPQVVIEVELGGSVTAGFAASVLQDASVRARAGYIDGKLGGEATEEGNATADTPSFQGNIALEAAAGPRFEVLLYGAVGPYAEAQGTLKLDAALGGPPLCVDWELRGGAEVDVGLQLFGDIEANLFDDSTVLTSYDSCADASLPPQNVQTWSKSFGRSGSAGEESRAIVEVSSGGYLLAAASATFAGVTASNAAFWLLRLDAEGTLLWQRAYASASGSLVSAAEVPGGFMIATRGALLRVDLAGNLTSARRFDTSEGLTAGALGMDALADGSVVVGGIGGPIATPLSWAMRVSPQGAVLWSSTYGGDEVRTVRRLSAGDVMLVGGDANTARIVRVGADGVPLWASAITQRYDDNGDDEGGVILDASTDAYDLVESPAGFVVVGVSYGGYELPTDNAVGFFAAWRANLNADGSAINSTIYRSSAVAEYNTLNAAAMSTGGIPIFLGEVTEALGASDSDLLLLRGTTTNTMRTSGDDNVYELSTVAGGRPLIATRDGGYAVTVTSGGFGASQRVWVSKLTRTGDVDLVPPAAISSTSGISLDVPLVSATVTPNVARTEVPMTLVDITASVAVETAGVDETVHSAE